MYACGRNIVMNGESWTIIVACWSDVVTFALEDWAVGWIRSIFDVLTFSLHFTAYDYTYRAK
jgi:hypothetical protein